MVYRIYFQNKNYDQITFYTNELDLTDAEILYDQKIKEGYSNVNIFKETTKYKKVK